MLNKALMRGLTVLALVMVVMAGAVVEQTAAPQPAEAASVAETWSGSVTSGPLASWHGNCTQADGGVRYYDAHSFTVPKSGTYTISLSNVAGMHTEGDWASITLYTPSFTGDYTANCIGHAPSNPTSLTIDLDAGTTYVVLVMSAYCNACGSGGYAGGGTYTATVMTDMDLGEDAVAEEAESAPAPGCNATVNIPGTAVSGQFTSDALVYWAPGQATDTVIAAGKTYYVDGLDASGMYRQVLLNCQWLWVDAGAVGPNYDEVWGGMPLPTHTVESSSTN